jgi:hypothetical protein
MDGGNTTVWLIVASAVLQQSVTFEFRLEPGIRRLNATPLQERGLPAKAACQSTSMLNVLTPSRASLAPTGFSVSSPEQGTPLS